MKSRAEIKETARNNFTANYWPCVGIMVLMNILMAVLACTSVGIIVSAPISVGINFFCLAMFFGDRQNGTLGNVFNVGFEKFGRNLGSMLLQGLLIFLWSLLLVVPGIIKMYAYAMAPFILADCPDVKAVDAITISRRMMKGHKWEYFVFQLSFIGWQILNTFTCGLLGVFYLTPYMSFSCAGYYAELKRYCIETGVIGAEEFEGNTVATAYRTVDPYAEDQTSYSTGDVVDTSYTEVETTRENEYPEFTSDDDSTVE